MVCWCHVHHPSPPHVHDSVSITRAALPANSFFHAKLSHGEQLNRIKTGLRKLTVSNIVVRAVVSDSVVDEGKVLDDFPVRADSEREEGEGLELFYDDGYGSVSVRELLDAAKEMIRPDGGPPRWFCPVECGRPIKGAPILLFLPGIGGSGFGLILHHVSLGKVFEVRCLHVPAYDRTPFEGLVKFVEAMVRLEYALSPNKPLYLVGDSFGGCLALAVAARNPTIDLILILANPATSIEDSQLQTIFPLMKSIPSELHTVVPYLLSFVMGDTLRLEVANIGDLNQDKSPMNLVSRLQQLSICVMEPREISDSLFKIDKTAKSYAQKLENREAILVLGDARPKDTFLWKLDMLMSGAAYANSRLHAVKAEVLVLASGADMILPSKKEAERLQSILQNCKVRYFNDHGHSILSEDGIHLFSVIKRALMYRRSSKYDYVYDFLPPSRTDYELEFEKETRIFRLAASPVIMSTLKDGHIVSGLAGVPSEGPVLLVGDHMLLGIELPPLIDAFFKEKNVLVRGMAHPIIFSDISNSAFHEISRFDMLRLFGATPVSAKNMYKLLSSQSFVLLFPGGGREAFHLKGEQYQLFWPEQPEFIRMAARFGATIVPFGVIGEDDVAELVLDYNDQMNIPIVRDWLESMNSNVVRVRSNVEGEAANQKIYIPVVLPKLPGRFYYLFGKSYETKGKELLKNKVHAYEAYVQIKSEVERIMHYLKQKRNEDPYRSILSRIAYQASRGLSTQVPTFEP